MVGAVAEWMREKGNIQEGESLCRRALEGRRIMLGDRHPDTLQSISSLSLILEQQGGEGKLDEAEVLCSTALEGRREKLGESHPRTLISLHNMAILMQKQGKRTEADKLFREALVGRQVLGTQHPSTLSTTLHFGQFLLSQPSLSPSSLAEAQQLLEEAVDGFAKTWGEKHPDTIEAKRALSYAQRKRLLSWLR